MEYFNQLPEEITLDILSRLPADSVLDCKLVCRNRRSFVRHPAFSKMHLHHLDSGNFGFIALTSSDSAQNYNFQYFEYNENHESIERIRRLNLNPPFDRDTSFIGSVNGLICLCGEFVAKNTHICNPVTRELLKLPEISMRAGMYYWGTGFGYVSSTNEYKVVRVMSQEDTEVYIYTLGSGLGWRYLGKFNFQTCGQLEEDGIFHNGALYWVNSESQMIVPFDLAEEKFLEHLPFHLPPDDDFEDYYYYYHELGVLDGCLSLTINHKDGTKCWDIWLLKNKNDIHCMEEGEKCHPMGWSKEFRVCANEPFAATKSYNVLTYSGDHINIQEPEASTSKTIVDFNEFISRVYPHKNTVISLKELGEEEVKIMESVEIADAETHDSPFNQLLEDETLDTHV